eukprot:297960_1
MGSWIFPEFYPPEEDDASTSMEQNQQMERNQTMEHQPNEDALTKIQEGNIKWSRGRSMNDVSRDSSACNSDREYSASAASSGSGFHGETAILGRLAFDEDACLPSDAHQILDSIQQYLANIQSDENIMNAMTSSDSKFMKNVWDAKLQNTLNDLITNNKMSKNAYNLLTEIFNALQAHQYEIAKRKITQITKNTKEFKVNKKWIMGFKSMVRIAKQR